MSILSFTDRFVDGIDAILAYAHGAIFKTDPRAMLDLFTTDDDHTFVTKEGVLITLVKVRGITSTMYSEELVAAIEEISAIMGKGLVASGAHDIQISYEFDPDQAEEYARRALYPSRKTAHRLGLGKLMDVVFEEKAAKMAEFCQVENCYIALSSSPASIHKADMKGQVKERAENLKSWPETAQAMMNDFAYPNLRTRHRTMVSTFISSMGRLTSLKDVGLMMQVASVRNYLKEVKKAVDPDVAPKWEPRIAADVFKDIRVPVTPKERNPAIFDAAMPPALGDQIFSRTPQTIGLQYAVLGNRIYYPVALSLGPTQPETFDRLVQQASDLRLPFRISFGLKAAGNAVDYINSLLAKTFFWTSNGNNQIKNAYDGLQKYEDQLGGFVPAMYVTACTWAPLKNHYSAKKGEVAYDLEQINERAAKLNRILQSWGGCQTTDAFNAPIEGVLSTQAGLYNRPLGGVLAPPMNHAIGMSPLFRPTTSWETGNVLLRTGDGRFLHYEQTSSKQNAWVTLLVGPMGFSKSTTLNTLNLLYLMNPSQEQEMPFLRSMDIGPSSRSIIDLVQASSRPGQEHVAQYIRIQNSTDYQVNPFDTPLGVEFPLPNHSNYLINFISTICYSMEADKVTAARLPGLVATLLKKLYKSYASSKNGGDRARTYYRRANPLVDEMVDLFGIDYDELTTWHEIRDALFAHGKEGVRAALIAHRKAMPILGDLIGIASSDEVRQDYPDIIGGVSLIDLFNRSIREAMELYPILQGETRFELGEARVISLDMEDLVPREQTQRGYWQASVAFFIGYNLLTSDFFFHRDYLKFIPKGYLRYHSAKVRALETARKRFSMDERQRFANIGTAQQQVDSLIAEGRKNFIDIQVASQLFEHHTEQSIKLASTIIILGAGNMDKEEVENVRTRFSLTPAQMNVLRKIRKPSSKGAEAMFIWSTGDGTQVHHTYLSEGSVYLWLIATEAVDRSIRNLMYERFARDEALMRLARRFPGGSIKDALQAKLADQLDADEEASDDLIRELADECSELEF